MNKDMVMCCAISGDDEINYMFHFTVLYQERLDVDVTSELSTTSGGFTEISPTMPLCCKVLNAFAF